MVRLSRRRFLGVTGAGMALGLAGCIEGASSTTWPVFRGSGDNDASDRVDPGTDLEVSWTVAFDEYFDHLEGEVLPSSPVSDETHAFVSGAIVEDGERVGTAVIAIELASGEVDWSRSIEHLFPTENPIAFPAVVSEYGLVVIGGQEAVVLSRADGTTRLEIGLPYRPRTAPTGADALVAIGDETLTMIDLEEDEDVRWHRGDDGPALSTNPPTIIEDRLFVPAEDGLIAFRRGDGVDIWREDWPAAGGAGVPPLVDGHHLYVRASDPDAIETIHALERGQRNERWTVELGHRGDRPMGMSTYRAGRLISVIDDRLTSITVGNGELAYDEEIDASSPFPTIGGDHVYVLDADELVVADRENGTVETRISLPDDEPAAPVEPVPREEVVLVTRSSSLIGFSDAN